MKGTNLSIRRFEFIFNRIGFPEGATFSVVAGAILFFSGAILVIGGAATTQLLNLPDSIFSVPIRYVMLVSGCGNLAIAFVCLFMSKWQLNLSLSAWFSASFIAYRLGLWEMGWRHSCGFLVDPLGISSRPTDFILTPSFVFLFIGSITILGMEYKKSQAANSLKTSCPSCGGHIRFAKCDFGRRIPCPHCQVAFTLRPHENLKMPCYFCNGNIEFPSHALGEKIKCPHCKMGITLKESGSSLE